MERRREKLLDLNVTREREIGQVAVYVVEHIRLGGEVQLVTAANVIRDEEFPGSKMRIPLDGIGVANPWYEESSSQSEA